MNKFFLKSSSKKSLDLYLQFLKLIFDKLGFTSSFFYLPITKKRIALLKSPHVYKKFKEHFEIRNYKVIFSFSSFLNLKVLKYFFMNKPKSVFLKFKFSQKNYLSLEAQVLTSVIGSMDPSLLTGPLLFAGTTVIFLFLYNLSLFSSSGSHSSSSSSSFATKGNEKKPLEQSTPASIKEEPIKQEQELLEAPYVESKVEQVFEESLVSVVESKGEQVFEETLVSVVESKVEQILEQSLTSAAEMEIPSADYLEKLCFLRDRMKKMLECIDRKDALFFDSEN
jgi:ribosomal protein S10